MRFVREIGEKGQVVIPVDIRELLKIRRGSKIIFEIEKTDNGKEEIKIRSKRENTDELLNEFFSIARTKGKDLTLEDLKKIEDESYDLP